MNYQVLTYSLYLAISFGVTIWVARTLSQNGLPFLVDCFAGNRELGQSINHLLVVGFYLINLGFIARNLQTTLPLNTEGQIFEVLSAKLGIVLLVLGVMHFFNLLVLTRWRRRALRELPFPNSMTVPPVIP